jgi:hypothetical protein
MVIICIIAIAGVAIGFVLACVGCEGAISKERRTHKKSIQELKNLIDSEQIRHNREVDMLKSQHQKDRMDIESRWCAKLDVADHETESAYAAVEAEREVIRKNAEIIKVHFANMKGKCQELLNMMTITIDGKECTDGGDRDEDEPEGS